MEEHMNMGEQNGWIKLYRNIQNHWIWKDEKFDKTHAWIDLLLLANYSDTKIPYKGDLITCERGTVNISKKKLAERWGWDRKTVTSFLSSLEKDGSIVVKASTHRTTITIVNYDFYQGTRTTEGATEWTTDWTTKGQQTGQPRDSRLDTTNKDKENKKEKKNNIRQFVAPTLEEVIAYCRERGNGIDPEKFIDYYQARGWELSKGRKMKDWKAAVRTWESNSKKWNCYGSGDNNQQQDTNDRSWRGLIKDEL